MGDYSENFYAGADYGFDPEYGSEFSAGVPQEYAPSVSQFGYPTDPRTANQVQAVSTKLNTGASTVEVSGVTPQVFESIPDQHLKEINRLKQLTGTDLTFHGPILEPSGFGQRGWNKGEHEKVQKQMWSAVQRAQQLEPDGNLVVTFHSGALGADPERRVKDEKTGKEVIKEILVADEASGGAQYLQIKPNFFKGEEKIPDTIEEQQQKIKESIEKQNKDTWFKQLFGVTYHANVGSDHISKLIGKDSDELPGVKKEAVLDLYKEFIQGKDFNAALQKIPEEYQQQVQNYMGGIVHGDTYLRDAYQDLQNMFNQAYEVAQQNGDKKSLAKMNNFREQTNKVVGDIEDPSKLTEFSDLIVEGVNVLRSVGAPQTLKPFRDFTIDKSSDTFSNLAFNSYKEFKKNAPIISIENPPAGDSPLYRAEDLRDLVEASRKKAAAKFVQELGLSKSEAKKQAEKLLGVTWDVGHINMIRKFGYDDKDIVSETKTIKPYLKHIHLSDNFGLDHTELPMGMGNVPLKPMMEALGKYNKRVKQIVETGNWFEPFRTTPVRETLRAFGSPIYSMQMSPSWAGAANASGGYFAGYGQMLPDQHFNLYGAGFSNLPPELGGQLSGTSRASGAPLQ